jgi:undecaprenyl-phosphate 4-deoxy-4-formamido-L-arabinose transferase
MTETAMATAKKKSNATPELSVVIPVYNEQESLPTLFERLYPALDLLLRTYEVIFVDDGSADRSVAMLREQFERRPDVTRVVILQSNFGQHAAILAGFDQSRGDAVVTLDADLQNPPEEIGNLMKKMDEGYDYVGTIRRKRQDIWWRKHASRAMNRLRERITKVKMTDQGCMLRAYSRDVIDAINNTSEINTFIPALAYLYSAKPVEIEVEHDEREAGASKYSLYSLIRLNFDLITGFSVVPLQVFSFFGVIIAALSFLLFLFLVGYRLFYPEGTVQGVFTLFALAFFFIGILLFGIGLLGEYVGRIYQEVQRRPRFLIRSVLEKKSK